MTPKHVVVSGYATLDYVVHADAQFQGTGTVTGKFGVSGAWPRAGGAALYASRRIANAGLRAHALTWVGDDEDGTRYLGACRDAGILADAVNREANATTARCILAYYPDGDFGCLLDVGSNGQASLTAGQRTVLTGADHLCIAAGPPRAAKAILDVYPPDRPVSWIAKLDRHAFPSELCRQLAQRADIVFCNSGEREFINAAYTGGRPAQQIIIETLGSDGVLIDAPNGKRRIPTTSIDAHDTTGAGDTLAGEVIAQILGGVTTIDDAVLCGMAAARDMLARRLT